jgi:hypothetical protein
MWGLAFAGAFAACGGKSSASSACTEENTVADDLLRAAQEDKLSLKALCLKTESELTMTVGAERAAWYVATCKRLKELDDECKR